MDSIFSIPTGTIQEDHPPLEQRMPEPKPKTPGGFPQEQNELHSFPWLFPRGGFNQDYPCSALGTLGKLRWQKMPLHYLKIIYINVI